MNYLLLGYTAIVCWLLVAWILFCYLIDHDILISKHLQLLLLLLLLRSSELNDCLGKALIHIFVISSARTEGTRLHSLLVISCVTGRVGSRLLSAILFLSDRHGVAVRTHTLVSILLICLTSGISSPLVAFERLHFNSYFNFIISKINLASVCNN